MGLVVTQVKWPKLESSYQLTTRICVFFFPLKSTRNITLPIRNVKAQHFKIWTTRGRGGVLEVSILAFNSNDPVSNLAGNQNNLLHEKIIK